MKKIITNNNYAASIVEIKNKHPLEKCDNVQGTSIYGNHVIISKDTDIGDIGIFFPVECQISNEFLMNNNLYNNPDKNIDKEKKGYFEENGRVRAIKFRGLHVSSGFYMSLNSLSYLPIDLNLFEIDDTFNNIEIDNIEHRICKKYFIRNKKTPFVNKVKTKNNILIEGQFQFHVETEQFAKNIKKFNLDDIISITYKIHGTSFVCSKIKCKRKETFFEKIIKKLHLNVNIQDTEYKNIYSSRTVIRNSGVGEPVHDIWYAINEKLKHYLSDGLSIYGEAVGYNPTEYGGKMIQEKYDYGCNEDEFKIYIYRITYTSNDNKIYEFTIKQIEKFCELYGLNCVPLLYYGSIYDYMKHYVLVDGMSEWQEKLVNILRENYLEKFCFLCKNEVPAEGIVIRREHTAIEPFKLKSFSYLKHETDIIDKNIVTMEDDA